VDALRQQRGVFEEKEESSSDFLIDKVLEKQSKRVSAASRLKDLVKVKQPEQKKMINNFIDPTFYHSISDSELFGINSPNDKQIKGESKAYAKKQQ
jgi:hypothetical protein